MKKYIKQFRKYKVKILGLLLIGCSTLLYGAEASLESTIDLETQLQQAVILPLDYHHKVYIRGNYVPVYEDYKIASKNNTTYLPLRLMTQLMTHDQERWEVKALFIIRNK